MPQPVCSVCDAALQAPLYESSARASLTSLCRIQHVRTTVFCCRACAHLQTPALEELTSYYADEYDILVASEEEDQIYEVQDSVPVFRTAHQVKTLMRKLAPAGGLQILDYGCAKSSTMRNLLISQPDLKVHLFDVSSRYVPYWRTFLQPGCWAVDETPSDWGERFDLITSFFSLEHIPDLSKTLDHMVSLLRPGGSLYVVVPNVLTNIADFIVVDHCNHFTAPSLRRLATQHGLVVEDLDTDSHRGALVMVARKSSSVVPTSAASATEIGVTLKALAETSQYWRSTCERLASFEETLTADMPLAIYGAGFYGTFIASNLHRPERVVCHLDQNPYLHGKDFNGRPVLPPDALPAEVRTILVGLNPRHAREAIGGIPALQRPDLSFFFL